MSALERFHCISKSKMQLVLTCYVLSAKKKINSASFWGLSIQCMDINIYNFTPHLPLVCKSTDLKTSFPYVNVPIIVIPPNSKPIYLFCNCYLFQVNKSFGKRKSCISIHVKSKINNGSALVGRKDCKRKNISRQPIWYFYLNIAQRCHRHFKISLL